LESEGVSLDRMLGGSDNFKSAMLVGTRELGAQYESDTLYVGLTWLAPGLRYPPHAHDAAELYQVLAGEASWGPMASHMAVKVPGEFIYHSPCLPHSIHVPLTEPLVTVYAWTGQLKGKFWFIDPRNGDRFSKTIKNVVDPKDYYEEMAGTYEEVVRAWGYNMPEVVAEKLLEHISFPGGERVLDLGCGDGMVGSALAARGVTSLRGLDLSPHMLDRARARGVYQHLEEADLLQTLPIQDCSFTTLTCVGTSTYLDPRVLRDWVRVVAPGGLLVFTHKSLVVGRWEEEQARMEGEGLWTLVNKSRPLYYLPSGPLDPSQERVFVFLYRKV